MSAYHQRTGNLKAKELAGREIGLYKLKIKGNVGESHRSTKLKGAQFKDKVRKR